MMQFNKDTNLVVQPYNGDHLTIRGDRLHLMNECYEVCMVNLVKFQRQSSDGL